MKKNNNKISEEKNSQAYEIILQILGYYQIKSANFCHRIGTNPSYVSDAKNGKTKRISKDIADKIIQQWPEISLTWLLTGEGEMLRSSSVPAVDVTAKGGRSNSEGTAEQVAILRALLEDKERQLAEANQMIGQLRLQLQMEREKTPSLSAQIETKHILP